MSRHNVDVLQSSLDHGVVTYDGVELYTQNVNVQHNLPERTQEETMFGIVNRTTGIKSSVITMDVTITQDNIERIKSLKNTQKKSTLIFNSTTTGVKRVFENAMLSGQLTEGEMNAKISLNFVADFEK